MKVSGLLVASAALVSVPLWGDTAAELLERGIYGHAVQTNDVAADATATLTAPVTYSARTTVVKTGDGTLVMPASTFRQGSPARVQVAGGKVTYVNDLPTTAAPAPLSAAVQAKLVFWGSVKDADHLQMNGAGIERMYDLRETDTNNLSHVYLEAEHFEGAAAPTLKDAVLVHQYHTSSNTYEMAYFGGYGSGVAMKFLNPDGKAYVTRLYETAAVYALPWGITDFGFLFGNCKTTSEHTLWNEGNALPWPDVWGPVSGDVAVWLDGVSRDRNTGMTLPNGIHVLQERYNTLPTNENLNNFENALFSTKALASSKGGQFVGEVMVFSSRLTDMERMEVQNYLTAKWNLNVNLAPARVELNAGTTLEVDTDAGTTNKANLLVTGEGMLVKKGEGTLWYRPEAREAVTPGKVDLQEGAIIASGAFTLKATPGMKVTAAAHGGVDYSGVCVTKGSASAANAIEKEGTGYVAIDEIPAGTRRLSVKAGTLGIRSSAAPLARYEVAIPMAALRIGEAIPAVVIFMYPRLEAHGRAAAARWASTISTTGRARAAAPALAQV